MRERRKTFNAPPAGGSSLMAIFAILALTIFAVLCISSMSADKRLGQSQADAVTAYYNADCQSEMILSKLRAGEVPSGVTAEGNIYSWSCPISETQHLEARVLMNGSEYTVLQWNSVTDIEWTADDSLPVWTGE